MATNVSSFCFWQSYIYAYARALSIVHNITYKWNPKKGKHLKQKTSIPQLYDYCRNIINSNKILSLIILQHLHTTI